MQVRVVRLAHGRDLPLPAYQSAGAAGLDLVAAVARAHTLKAGQRQLIPTGLVLELPPGLEAQVRPRSGLALRHGVTVLNSPGTIDCDYRGEVQVLLVNLGEEPFQIRRGDRIAQLVVQRVERVELIEAAEADATVRGARGFGSTGRETSAPPKRRARSPNSRSKKRRG